MKFSYLNYMADLYGYSIGSTIKALKLLHNLELFGHAVAFHWLGGDRPHASTAAPANSSARSFFRDLFFTPGQLLRNVRQFFREQQLIKQDHPDALIVRLDAFRLSALWLARLYRLPLIVEADGACSYEWLTFNNGRHLWDSALLWCERLMLKGANGIFTQSKIAKDYYTKMHGLDPDSITVITNGADPYPDIEAGTSVRARLGISQDAQVIGFIGSMQRWHGLQDMRSLVDDLLASDKNVLFLFVGSGGALEKELRESLQHGGRRIIFTGAVPNDQVAAYVRAFTIAVAPYPPIDLFYFSPMKIFEYMSAGVPIVASRSGQISDILRDGESALLYEPGDYAQLKTALIRLVRDVDLRTRIADNARALFGREHTWQHKAKELDDFLSHCLHMKDEPERKV
ncbi:glycosyltransferase family 4 protein [candidate division KSB1 bacterium]|nr:glycosyltransferase family 4 protein [candidate division KSB1 bacterium]RQW01920.1 MAG: glycosyltransferase family 1 protein [candidate division KSB1 bacterium]